MKRICPFCGVEIPDAEPGQAQTACPNCGQAQDNPDPAAPAPPHQGPQPALPVHQAERPAPPYAHPGPPLVEPEIIAWEDEGNFFKRLFMTMVQVAFRPRAVFSSPAKPGMGWPLSFFLILNTLVIGLVFLMAGAPVGKLSALTMSLIIFLFPLLSVALAFYSTAWVHLLLLMFRGGSAGFAATLRVGCYAQGVAPVSFIPVVGPLVQFVWGLVVETIGLATTHRTGTFRAFCAVAMGMVATLLPILAVVAYVFGPRILQYIKSATGGLQSI